jgi:flagellar protein FlbD
MRIRQAALNRAVKLADALSGGSMISVTRLNGKKIVVNAELIRTVEANPDTTVKLTNGDHIIVRESMDEVVELAVEYGRSLRKVLPPT